ncbi:MAG: hypothetical protein J7J06_08350 [Methanosarcinales archaeon]|nr:hypothetical protein [Methanosarcinales archaeon]
MAKPHRLVLSEPTVITIITIVAIVTRVWRSKIMLRETIGTGYDIKRMERADMLIGRTD